MESELENVRNQSVGEKSRFEKRIQELQYELQRRDAELDELRKRGSGFEQTVQKMRIETTEITSRY